MFEESSMLFACLSKEKNLLFSDPVTQCVIYHDNGDSGDLQSHRNHMA